VKSFFVNEAFDKAVNDYLISKDKEEGILYNSFLVVVIRMLINIYGELDIVNPFQTKNEDALNDNLMKYGASKEKVDKLKNMLNEFYTLEKKNKQANKREDNSYFIDIQKVLIDLFVFKKNNFGMVARESHEFFDLLYTPGTSNALRLSYNFLNADNIYEVAEYYKVSMEKKDEIVKETKNDLLGFDVYRLFNLSIADLSKMNEEEIKNLNSQIYKSFDISENAINKDYLLSEKVKEIKFRNNPITTGNGYVDILLVMSVIITTIMVVIIFSTLIF